MDPPRIENPLPNVCVRAGEPLKLECQVAGTRPTLVWLHNSRNLADARDVQIRFSESTGLCSVEIREVFPRHAGIYTLLARNASGETYTSCNVTLASRPPPETSDSDLTSDIELSKPVVRQALRDQNVVEGDSACLQCTITGVPEPEVIWYHNSKPIKESRDYKFLFEGDRCSLVIPSVTKNHQGSYRCKALNPAGETSSSCRVKVTPSPPTMEIAAAGSASSLRISRLLSDVNCRHGDRFKLIIEIEGCNEPEVIWSFQGRPILLDQDFVFDQIGKSYILEIPKATLDHAGTYSVEARDPTGSRHSSCRVIVDPPPQSSLALIQAAGGGSDVVSTHVTKSFVSSKKTMLMQKVSASKSEATTGGQTVHSEEHQAATTEKHGYEKMGDNAPQEYHSKESFGFDRLGSNPPQHYHTKEVRDNRIEGQQTQLAIEGKAAEGTQASVLPVTELAAQAVNITTRVSEPRQVSILQRSGSAHIAPKFTKPVASVAVFEGEPLKLEGWFTGHPEPIVKWSRGSTTLSNKAELQLTIKEGYTSLAIPRAMLKDYARYTCVISNDVGSSSSAADVVVQTKREAPQFTRRLAARVYRTGSDITLEVEVSGQPQPEVKWLRDEQDLKAINRYKIQSSGNIHTLKMRNVTGADSGRITVLATNVAGEAQSIADIFVEDDASTDEEREVSIRDYHIEDEKKMEVTVVQAEHLHRENTVLIERNVTPKPKVLALPAPTPQPQEPPKQLPMPVGTPTQTDEDSRMRTSVDERIEKHVHTSQNILKRQQQFIKQNTTETSRFTLTPPPESPKPRIEAPITPAGSPLPPAEQPKPTKQSPPAAAPSPPPPPVRAPTPPRKEPKSVPRPVVPQHVEKLPLIPKAVPDPPAQSHIVQRDSVQTIQQQTQMTRKEELRTVISHQYQQEHFGLRTTEPNPRDSPRPVRTSSPPPPTPELPPVNSQIMAERKVEQRSRTIEFVAPPSPLLPKELPGPPPGIPGAKPKRLPTVEALAPLPPVQPKVKALPEKQAAFIRSPTPVLVRPIVAPPTPPPPPIVKPIVAPPPQRRPPPPPQFKDELLTYEQIRRQEEERIQKHCRKITLIEQRERQTQRRENQTHIGTVSLTKTPVPLDPPDVRLKPIECKMVTEIIEPPKPQNLEEAVSEFYKVHDETTRRVRTIVRQEVRTQSLPPQNIPVVSVQSLTFPPPPPPPKRSPEPMCHVEKKESHRFQQTRDFRSISPVLLQKSLHKEPRAPSPTPMCAIQEIDLLKQKSTQQKDPVDILNFTSTVTRQKYSPEPVQYVDLRERRSVPPPSTTPLCHLQEIDHRLTGVDRVDTTLLVEMTEKQKHTKAAQSMELGNKYLSIDETNQTTRVPSEPVRFCVREQTSRSINTKQKQQNSLVSSTLSSTNNTPVHWSRRCRSVDRNVLLTETTRERKDAVDLVNKSWLSERRSVPRNPPPSSATVYIDQHTKVITAPPVLPVQNLPVLPIVRRSDQISTVSVGVSDERPSWQPIAPSLVEGRYSFRGVTDSKVSADTSLVRIETSTVPAPPSTARRDELRQVHPQEPLYRTFPAKNSATKPAVPLVDYLTLHQLEGRSSNMARNWSEQNAYLEQRSYRSTDIEKSMVMALNGP